MVSTEYMQGNNYEWNRYNPNKSYDNPFYSTTVGKESSLGSDMAEFIIELRGPLFLKA